MLHECITRGIKKYSFAILSGVQWTFAEIIMTISNMATKGIWEWESTEGKA